MATGGRVLHHLTALAPDPRNTILFAGYQAARTRGEAITNGVESVKIHGEEVPIRAEVANLSMLSAHADRREMLEWLGRAPAAPKRAFITHGEPAAADALRKHVERELHWTVTVPDFRDRFTLA